MKKNLLVLSLAIMAIFIFVGCGNSTDKTKETAKTEKQSVVSVITTQWQGSTHAKPLKEGDKYIGLEANCFGCHNGYGFENKDVKDVKELGKLIKGATCDTCHTAKGAEIMKAGSVQTKATQEAISGGKGSLCIACHNGRGKKPDLKSAPHGSVQADVILSKNGAQVEGFTYGKSPHVSTPDSCLACHMAADTDGVKDHSFKMNVKNIKNSCVKCHDKFDSFNPVAAGDYDGNGKKEGIQTEVDGLMKLLNTEITKQLNGGKFKSEAGKITFVDAQDKPVATPPKAEVYNAAWNYFFITNDGSKGVHNPVYTVQLLQQSYKALTGKDVPSAEIMK